MGTLNQDKFYSDIRNKVLEFLKSLSDESDNNNVKEACKNVAKDIIDAPDMRLKLDWMREINRINREDAEFEAMK